MGQHKAGGDKRMARNHRRGRGMRGPGPQGMPGHMAPMGPGGMGPHQGGQEMMGELAALGVRFYQPPMVIRRAQEIGLTPDQLTKIRQEMVNARSRSIDLKGKIEHAKIEVARLLAADKVDEKAIAAQVDEASKAGGELHKLHLGVMLHVRALLTPEQRQKLDQPRQKKQGPKPAAGAGPTGPLGQAVADEDDDDDDDDFDDYDDAEG